MDILVLKKNGVVGRYGVGYQFGYDEGFIECRGDVLDLVVTARSGVGHR